MPEEYLDVSRRTTLSGATRRPKQRMGCGCTTCGAAAARPSSSCTGGRASGTSTSTTCRRPTPSSHIPAYIPALTAPVRVLPGIGHFTPFEAPEEMADAIRALL